MEFVSMSESARERCAWVGCEDPSEAKIFKRPLCSYHFCLVAQRRLSALLGHFTDEEADRDLSPEAQQFLSELVSEAAILTTHSQQLGPDQMEELLELSAKAAELNKKIQPPG
jgi:hypothetical protein